MKWKEFDKFFKEIRTKYYVQRLNIRLYLSRAIIDTHNGLLTVKSDEKDKEATFIIELKKKKVKTIQTGIKSLKKPIIPEIGRAVH